MLGNQTCFDLIVLVKFLGPGKGLNQVLLESLPIFWHNLPASCSACLNRVGPNSYGPESNENENRGRPQCRSSDSMAQ